MVKLSSLYYLGLLTKTISNMTQKDYERWEISFYIHCTLNSVVFTSTFIVKCAKGIYLNSIFLKNGEPDEVTSVTRLF